MKTLKSLFLIGILSLYSNSFFAQSSCIDSSIIDQSIICPQVIDPVCGCDGITYSNSCEATNYYGVTSYTPGACGGNPCNFTFWSSITEPNCNYSCDGSLTVWATGATVSPYNYTYLWSNGGNTNTLDSVCCGAYTVYATDSLGCTSSTTINVTCPPEIQITATSTPQTYLNPTTNGYGSITVNASGGSPGYLYSIDNGNSYQGSNTFYGLVSGIYIVQVMDDNGCIAIYTIQVEYDPCQANFTYTSGQSPCQFIFSATGADNYVWNFGDGNTEMGQNVSHTYTSDGTYIISLGAYTDNGGWLGSLCDSLTQTLTVTGCGNSSSCQASFNYADSNCIVEFYGAGASDYYWDFGDGNSGQGQYDYHAYSNNGTYNVCMYAYDQNGVICDTVCQNIYVSGCNSTGGCQTSFTYTMGQSPCEFIFSASGASSYSWDFGDGNSGTGQNVSNTYSNDDMYYVLLLGYNSNGVLCDSISQYLTLTGCGGNTPCQASFNYADSNCIVEFYGSGASTYTWDFGDGSSGQGQYDYHVYSNNGNYNVCMYAFDQNGMICDTVCQYVYVTGCNNTGGGCQTYFTYTMGQSPCEFIFSATGAYTYTWDFGDGNSGTGQNVSNTYSNDGMYYVLLMGYNPNGVLCDSIAQYLTLTGCDSTLCEADFIPYVDSNCTVYFENYSSGASSYEWIFGDGNSSNQVNPQHTYTDMGPYTVLLIAYDIQGFPCDSVYQTIVLLDCSAGLAENINDFGLEIYPNPTTSGGKVDLTLPMSMNIDVKILSIMGEIADVIYTGHLDSGKHSIQWNNYNLASGMYIIQISTPYGVQKKKLLIQK